MQVLSTSGVVHDLTVGLSQEHSNAKLGCLTVKATFNVARDGSISLETDAPEPIHASDEETPLGIMPSELPLRRSPDFEVMALAAAYAPGGAPAQEATVTLSVGPTSKSLRIVGDRRWVEGPDGPTLTAPAPFHRMPLTWERAFGGTANVWLDDSTVTQVSYAVNPRGRGFDPAAGMAHLGEQVFAADGFPRTDYVRLAPNIEDPAHPTRTSEHAPPPVGFAPPPVDCGIATQRVGEHFLSAPEEQGPLSEVAGLRAAPGLVFPAAPLGQPVRLSGCLPEGDFHFVLPSTLPEMDYVIGDRSGTRALTPQALMLLPENRRFYLVYRHFFHMQPGDGEERSLRLRFG